MIESIKFLAQEVVQQLDQQFLSCCFLAKGSTCEAFKVVTDKNKYVLRVSAPNRGKVTRFESDYLIRQSLSSVANHISTPIATNKDIKCESSTEAWALDTFCEGNTLARGEIPASVSHQLGRVLKQLHALPVVGYGILKNQRDSFQGSLCNPIDGMLSRFERPWPFCDTNLREHPAVVAEPSLFKPLCQLEGILLDFLVDGTMSIVHGDLHEQQFLVEGQQLRALLDFNEAFAGRCEWDLGSYFYFHGHQCLQDLLIGYTRDAAERKGLSSGAWIASILIALHHGNRAVLLSRPHRLAASISHLNKATHNNAVGL